MHTTLLFSAATLAVAACLPAQDGDHGKPSSPSTSIRTLALDTLLDWESVRSPVFSPDGRTIVYSRTWTDKIHDRSQNELWIMSRDGSGQRFLTEGSSPKWSPDGTRIAFTRAGEPSGSQIHVLYLDDRSVTQLTHVDESPGSLEWSPDGTAIAFTMQVPEKSGFPIQLPKRPKGAKWAPEPTVITRLSYRRDRRGYRASGFRHIFTVSATGGTPRQITSRDFDHGSPEWTPTGEEILFSGLRAEDADWQIQESEIYAVNVANWPSAATDRTAKDQIAAQRSYRRMASGSRTRASGQDNRHLQRRRAST